jgi:outer membrane receptor protein involved in Fe transport
MNKVRIPFRLHPLWLACAVAGGSWQSTALAQDDARPTPPTGGAAPSGEVEEVLVTGRFLSASEEVAKERLSDASVVDTIGAEAIGRLGDSTVAAALRRVPGLSLVSDKFVYVRGLGERYSATTLNGAQIPSPDLTRNVIPLDVFPASVVESLRVQKAWAPDLSANFAGGSVDIRTRGIPQAFDFNFEVGSGFDAITPSRVNTYPGGHADGLGRDDGTRALSPAIASALVAYRGSDLSPASIRLADPSLTDADAALINRQLSLQLNRDIGFHQESPPPDADLKTSVGSSYDVGEKWNLGFLVGTTYQNHWRGTVAKARNWRFPDERTDTKNESLNSVDMSGTLNFGAKFTNDHEVSLTTLYLRNTDDRSTVDDFFNENRQISDGLGFRDYWLRYEERNMRTNQIQGKHYIGADTREMFPKIANAFKWLPEETAIQWFSSESKATTDIPNEVRITSKTTTDPVTAAVLTESVALQADAANYRFTDLNDRVRSNGWSITAPFKLENSTLTLSGGASHSDKSRSYEQTEFTLGPPSGTSPAALVGSIDQVFSDENVTNNGFIFLRNDSNAETYLAATMTDAGFGMADWTIRNKWRITGGARWEDYRQTAVNWNPYGYGPANPQVTTDPNELGKGVFAADKVYPALSFTYMGRFWADTFQLRLGLSRTAIRPDLREITDASYIDPITGDLTIGSSDVRPAEVRNLDLRAEWFFDRGDNFTVTFFQKDIDNPIEFFESLASDTTVAREIHNADSAEVHGVEIEGLKKLGFIGPRFTPFFLQGNLTLQDSNLVVGPRANAPTNPERPLAGASDYVANLMVGYDSKNQRHTVSLIYNVFGKRLYVAGRNQAPDGYELPFDSLDLTYAWYARDTLTFKAKAQNILDDSIRIERAGVNTYDRKPGRLLALSVQWHF